MYPGVYTLHIHREVYHHGTRVVHTQQDTHHGTRVVHTQHASLPSVVYPACLSSHRGIPRVSPSYPRWYTQGVPHTHGGIPGYVLHVRQVYPGMCCMSDRCTRVLFSHPGRCTRCYTSLLRLGGRHVHPVVYLSPKAGWEAYTLWYTLLLRLDGRHIPCGIPLLRLAGRHIHQVSTLRRLPRGSLRPVSLLADTSSPGPITRE